MRPQLPVSHGESFGQRLARNRKARGFTQVGIAEKVGLLQGLVSDYERDKLRPHGDIIVRFAVVLEVSAHELLGIRQPTRQAGAFANRRFLRRLLQVDKLSKRDQDALLRTSEASLAAKRAG